MPLLQVINADFSHDPAFPDLQDYGATTPVDPRVVDAMIPWLREHFGNPASRSHAWGWEAEAIVEKAREDVAALINADPREIVWTSGATESNNLALKGAAQFYKTRGKHLITVKTEHKAVLDTMRELERQGFEVTYLDVQEDGLLDHDRLRAVLRPDTILVSVMFVNNEIGVIQDIAAIGALPRARHRLPVRGAGHGKVAIDLAKLPVTCEPGLAQDVRAEGHGALYVRASHGADRGADARRGHDRACAPHLPTPQIVAWARRPHRRGEMQGSERIRMLHRRLVGGLSTRQTFLNGHPSSASPQREHVVHLSRASRCHGVRALPSHPVRPAPRRVSSPATCCARSAAATSSRTRACA